MGFITGTCVKTNYLASSPLLEQWDRCNAMVLNWFLSSLSQEVYLGHVFSSNAATVWNELKDTYDWIDRSIVFNLLQKTNSFKQGGLPIFEYYHKLNSLWREYEILTKRYNCTCSARLEVANYDKMLKLMQFHMGLDDIYQPIRSSILTREVLPEAKVAFLIISKEESHRWIPSSSGTVKTEKAQASAFVSKQSDMNRSRNNNWSKNGNNGRKGSSNNSETKTSRNVCFTNKQVMKLISLLNDKGSSAGQSNMAGWIIDSGVNQYMTNSIKDMVNLVDVSDLKLTVCHPNVTLAKITHVGNLKLNNDVMLIDVLVIPEYTGLKKGRVLGTGSEFGGLCLFDKEYNKSTVANNSKFVSCFVSKEVLHYGLGHPANQVLKLLKGSLNLSNIDHEGPCEIPTLGSGSDLQGSGTDGLIIANQIDENTSSEGNVSFNDQGLKRYANHTYLDSQCRSFIPNLNKTLEPSSFEEASKDPNWISVMNDEMNVLYENDTGYLVDIPFARVVVKGFGQKEGLDYEETFSPVVKMGTVRCLLCLAVQNEWDIYQMDINNAFLYGDLIEEVYMLPPPGFFDSSDKRVSCKPVLTPLPKNIILAHKETEKDKDLVKITSYQRSHFDIALRLLKYLKLAPSFGVQFVKRHSGFDIKAFFDSDWAKCLNLLPAELYCDNKVAMEIATNPVIHEKTKHFHLDVHFIREKILSSLSQEVYLENVFSSNAATVWNELKDTYDRIDGSIVFNLLQKTNSFKQGGFPVSEYYHKLNFLWREYEILTILPDCTCSARLEVANYDKMLKLMQFHMCLDDIYQPIRSSILTREVLPEAKEAFLIISREESNRGIPSSYGTVKTEKARASAFVSKQSDMNRSRNNNWFNNGNNVNRGVYDNLLCKKCGLKGHTVDKCFELIGYPFGFKRNPNMKHNTNGNSKSNSGDFKKGSSNNNKPKHLAMFVSLINSHPNGTLAKITHVGNLKLNNDVILFDVFVIPDYTVSLLSMHELIKYSKFSIGIDETKCYIRGLKKGRVLGTGSEFGGLYLFDNEYNKSTIANNSYLNLSNNDHEGPCEVKTESEVTNLKFFDCVESKPRPKALINPNDDEEGSSCRDGSVHQLGSGLDLQGSGNDGLITTTPIDENTKEVNIRKSSRTTKLPAKFNEYVLDNKVKYGLNRYANHTNLDSQSRSFISNLNKTLEPFSFEEASTDLNWISVINDEMNVLYENDTWYLVDLPVGRKPIGSKWVFKIKYKSHGEVDRFKARVIAKGFGQKEGLDYEETFSPVFKIGTVRCLLCLAVQNEWDIYQMDINNAFLYGDLIEEVYMLPPPGFFDPYDKRVCKLKKSLYGLKQDPRQWNQKLCETLKENGFEQSKNDHSFFHKKDENFSLFLLVSHFDIALRLLKYLKLAPSFGVQFVKRQSGFDIKAFFDSDWAKCPVTRRSMATTTCEIMWIVKIMSDLNIKNLLPAELYCDNKVAMQIAANHVMHEKTKHFELDVHFIREKVCSRLIKTVNIESKDNVVDILTKALGLF
nr:hypothetical protein [Tanacetum cinerariifolium]